MIVKYREGALNAAVDMPSFIYAKVTGGTASDAAELVDMISNIGINVGEMYLYREFSRANAQLIADIGAVPYIAIKSNVKSSQNLMAILHGTGWLICTENALMIMLSITTTGEA